MKTIPTVTEIRDSILADIEGATGTQTPLLSRAVWRVLATAQAGAVALLYRFGLWVRRQIFVATCDAEALVERGAEDGLTPKPAVAWRGFAVVTGAAGTTIPAGRPYRFGGNTYYTEADVTLVAHAEPAGAPPSAVITLVADEAGDAGTLGSGKVVSLVTPMTGVERDATVIVRSAARITGSGAATVPAGDLLTYSEVIDGQPVEHRYRVEETVALAPTGDPADPVTVWRAVAVLLPVDPERLEAIPAGETVSLTAPPAGVDAAATAVAAWEIPEALRPTVGEDAETVEEFRRRVRQRRRDRPQGGAAADYVAWALEVPGVVRAFAYSPAPGQVNVYPLVGEGENDRVPDTVKLDEVEAYVSATERRPLGARVEARAVTEVVFNVVADSFQLDTRSGATLQSVDEALRTYFLSRYPRQYDDEQGATDVISVAELHKVVFDAGARYASLTIERVDQPGSITGYELKTEDLGGTFAVEVAKLGAFTTASV